MNKKIIISILIGITIIIVSIFLYGYEKQSEPLILIENKNKTSEEVSPSIDTNEYSTNPEIELYQRYADGQMDNEEYAYELQRVLVEKKLGKDFSEEKIKQLYEAGREARESKGTGRLTGEIVIGVKPCIST